jgi:hypothetical protein
LQIFTKLCQLYEFVVIKFPKYTDYFDFIEFSFNYNYRYYIVDLYAISKVMNPLTKIIMTVNKWTFYRLFTNVKC